MLTGHGMEFVWSISNKAYPTSFDNKVALYFYAPGTPTPFAGTPPLTSQWRSLHIYEEGHKLHYYHFPTALLVNVNLSIDSFCQPYFVPNFSNKYSFPCCRKMQMSVQIFYKNNSLNAFFGKMCSLVLSFEDLEIHKRQLNQFFQKLPSYWFSEAWREM